MAEDICYVGKSKESAWIIRVKVSNEISAVAFDDGDRRAYIDPSEA